MKEFDGLEDFKIKVTNDLYKTILNYKFSTSKTLALKKFWKLGTPKKEGLPLLGIIYPAIGKNYMGDIDKSKIWLNRLEPNIVFEDFKALQKIQKSLRLVGFANYKIFNSQNVPNEVNNYNRFWICLPRNNDGRMQCDKYEQYARFKISHLEDRTKTHFLWKSNVSGDKHIKIYSPLSNYLIYQRSSLNIDGDWHSQLDNIIAKDYAILARFKERSSIENDNLFDYFLAGIRGLGTWGAAWFIDREYHWFSKNDLYDDMQVLLEIEYKKGEIISVRDVSEEPQSYFNTENSIKVIKNRIMRFNPALRL